MVKIAAAAAEAGKRYGFLAALAVLVFPFLCYFGG